MKESHQGFPSQWNFGSFKTRIVLKNSVEFNCSLFSFFDDNGQTNLKKTNMQPKSPIVVNSLHSDLTSFNAPFVLFLLFSAASMKRSFVQTGLSQAPLWFRKQRRWINPSKERRGTDHQADQQRPFAKLLWREIRPGKQSIFLHGFLCFKRKPKSLQQQNPKKKQLLGRTAPSSEQPGLLGSAELQKPKQFIHCCLQSRRIPSKKRLEPIFKKKRSPFDPGDTRFRLHQQNP